MKKLFIVVALIVSMATKAQVTKVYLQASGLTCSMCSNSINKALKTLDFVEEVNANLKDYTFEISFTEKGRIDFNRIRAKVENAGFSVSRFAATIYFDHIQLKAEQPLLIGNQTLLFVGVKDQLLSGEKQVRVVDEGFLSAKEYKRSRLQKLPPNSGSYHVTF